jgi:protein SMG7
LLLMNGHIIFNLEAVEVTAPLLTDVEAAQDVGQLLATIRDTSLDLLPKDPDDDNMTEGTSRTDDDVVRDAFKFLNTEGNIEDMDEDEDEIVWDLRHD